MSFLFTGFAFLWVILSVSFAGLVVYFENSPAIKWIALFPGLIMIIPSFLIWATGFFLTPVGVVLGMGGLFQKEQKKWISLMGIAVNALIFAFYCLIIPRIQAG